MEKTNVLNRRLAVLCAVVAMVAMLFPASGYADTDAASGKADKKVKIEYEYVTAGELSKAELAHLQSGLPEVQATKDAKYLLVYKEGAGGVAVANTNHKSGAPKTGDAGRMVLWLLGLTAAGALGYAVSRAKKGDKAKSGVAVMLASGMVLTPLSLRRWKRMHTRVRSSAATIRCST